MVSEQSKAPKFNEAGFLTLSMDVSKAESGKRVKVGEIDYFVPMLSAFGIAQEPTKYDEDSGEPIYEAEASNWLWSAIHASVKAQARNKLVSGTAEFKDGQSPAANLVDLFAEGERGGSGAALLARHALVAKFGVWVQSLGKKREVQDLLKGLFAAPKNLRLQEKSNRDKFAGYVTSFAETLDEADLASGQRYLQTLLDACEAPAIEADDF